MAALSRFHAQTDGMVTNNEWERRLRDEKTNAMAHRLYRESGGELGRPEGEWEVIYARERLPLAHPAAAGDTR